MKRVESGSIVFCGGLAGNIRQVKHSGHACNGSSQTPILLPDFRFYALADGIMAIFKRTGKGPLYPSDHESPRSPQLALWSG